METTSRMKDFYDIYYISGRFDFGGSILQKAIYETLKHRRHSLKAEILGRIQAFDKNQFLQRQWKAFVPAKEAMLEFTVVLNTALQFLKPVADSLINNDSFNQHWNSSKRAWEH